MQAVCDVHERPSPAGELGSLDHCLPVQRAATAPIVMQAESEVHDTARNPPQLSGTASIAQLDAAAAPVPAIHSTTTAHTQPTAGSHARFPTPIPPGHRVRSLKSICITR